MERIGFLIGVEKDILVCIFFGLEIFWIRLVSVYCCIELCGCRRLMLLFKKLLCFDVNWKSVLLVIYEIKVLKNVGNCEDIVVDIEFWEYLLFKWVVLRIYWVI